MKLFTGITKIAHIAPWMKVVNHDGVDGVWSEVGGKHKTFLNSRTLRVHLPKSLRGKALTDITLDDLKAVPKEDSGDTHYKLWREDFDAKREKDKIYNGYQFTPFGTVLLERLKRFMTKNKLDQVDVYGLDTKYSLDLSIFDKLLLTPQIDKVRRIGKTIAKKYRMIIELLKEGGKLKLANRMDKDFYYNWEKLEPVFEFDPASYKPTSPEEPEEDEVPEIEGDKELYHANAKFNADVQPLLNPQMVNLIKCIENLDKNIDANNIPKAQSSYENLCTELMKLVASMHNHEIGQNAEAILKLPSMLLLHDQLFGSKPL